MLLGFCASNSSSIATDTVFYNDTTTLPILLLNRLTASAFDNRLVIALPVSI
jgi:hypothetical protein